MERAIEKLMYWYMDRGLFKVHMLLGFAAFLVSILLRRFDWAMWGMLFFFSSWGLSIFLLLTAALSGPVEDEAWELGGPNVIEGEYRVVEPKGLPKPN